MSRGRAGGGRTAASVVLSATLLALLFPASASAHAFLVSSTPAAGARLDAAPASVSLIFTEAIARGSERIEVRASGGDAVATGRRALEPGGSTVEAALPQLDPGIYVVFWEARSAVDGHVEVGEFAFAVGHSARAPLPSASGSGGVAWPQAAARWLLMLGLLLGFGGLASEVLIWSAVGRTYGVAVPRLPVSLLLLAALAGSALQGILLLPDGDGQGWRSLLAGRAGLLAVGEVLLIAYALWLLPLRRLRPWAMVPTGMALVTAAVRGHAGSTAAWWAAPADAVHLAAVGLWSGALLHFLSVMWRLRDPEVRPAVIEGAWRYARTALWTVMAVVATGVAVAVPQFTAPGELVDTEYGRVLVVKVGLVAAALALAAAARRWGLAPRPGPRIGVLRRLAGREGALVLAVIAAASVLANAPPPRGASATAAVLGPPPLEGPVIRLAKVTGALAVYLGAAPRRLEVRILEPSREPAADARIEVTGRAPDGTLLGISPRRCGPGCATVGLEWQDGTTNLQVEVVSDEWGAGQLRFRVPWPPRPARPELVDQVVRTMRRQPRVTMVERVSSPTGGWATNRADLTGKRLARLALYAAGGATDVRPLPSGTAFRRFTLYLPGSSIWFLLEVDAKGRLRRETIVSPGHQIERTLRYPAE